MSRRLEAAVKAWDHHWGDRYGDEALAEMGEEVQVAMDAADAVMFSMANLARIAGESILSLSEVLDIVGKLKEGAE